MYSASQFNKVFSGKEFDLPIKWDGVDFYKTLDNLYTQYINKIKTVIKHEDILNIENLIKSLLKAVKEYLNGSPADAFINLDEGMKILEKDSLKVYDKSIDKLFWSQTNDPLKLFRVRAVKSNKKFLRRELFHIPYNQRSIVSTNRYGISGYPCLYLGTSLEQCCNEIYAKPEEVSIVVSAYILEQNIKRTRLNIKVIELGIKPQDFRHKKARTETIGHDQISKRIIPYELLQLDTTKTSYLLWYPLIAACSFIQANKKDPFVAEFIIPQLLMQWVRSKMAQEKELYGIQHFSCASVKASDMGYTYVFPTSGEKDSDQFPYCPILTKAFLSTEPVYIREYKNIIECEKKLRSLDIDTFYDSPRK